MFLRSIQQQYTIDPGYQTSRLALFMLYPGQAGYHQPRTEQFYKQVRDRLSNVPGISAVGDVITFGGPGHPQLAHVSSAEGIIRSKQGQGVPSQGCRSYQTSFPLPTS